MRGKTAGGVFWATLQNVARRLMTLVVFLVLARLLSPEDFGLVALATAFIAFIELFIRIGFAEAIVQRKQLDDAHLDTAFWTLIAIGAVLTLLSWSVAGPASRWFGNAELAPVLRWLSLNILLLSLTRVQVANLRRRFQFKKLAMRTLIASFFGGVIGVVLAFSGMGVWALVAQQLVEATVALVVLWASSDWRPGFKLSAKCFHDLFGFGAKIMGVQFMHVINQQAGKLIVGFFLGPLALGYYTVANRLVLIIQQVMSNTFVSVLYSSFSRMQDDMVRLRAAVLRSTRLIAIMVFPVFLFLAVAGAETVEVVFGDKWASSAALVQYLALAGLLQLVTIFHDPVFKAVGRPELALRVALLKTFLGVTLVMIAVSFGIEAVALAAMIQAAFVMPYSFYLINGVFPMSAKLLVHQLRAPLIGSMVLVGVIYVLRESSTASWTEGIVGLAITAFVAFSCYLLTVCLVDRGLVVEAWQTINTIASRGNSQRQGKVTGQND